MAALDVDPLTNTVGDKVVAMVDHAFAPAETKNSGEGQLVRRGGKLIIITAPRSGDLLARSILSYQLTATLHGDKAAASVRLFLWFRNARQRRHRAGLGSTR